MKIPNLTIIIGLTAIALSSCQEAKRETKEVAINAREAMSKFKPHEMMAEKYSQIVAHIKDAESAQVALGKMDQLMAEFDALKEKMQNASVAEVTRDKARDLSENFTAAMSAIQGRLRSSTERAREALKDHPELLKKFEIKSRELSERARHMFD